MDNLCEFNEPCYGTQITPHLRSLIVFHCSVILRG
jgi:hypothetical protein